MSEPDDPDDSMFEGQSSGHDRASWWRAKAEASADARDKRLERLRQVGMGVLCAIVLLTPQMLAFLVVMGVAVYMCIVITRSFARRLGQAIR